MGKYMRKAKTAGELTLMELAQASIGVRTRARTLALQRLQKSAVAAGIPSGGGSYIQLRSRRLEKPPIADFKRQKQTSIPNPNSNSRTGSRLRVNSGSAASSPLDASSNQKGFNLETGKFVAKEEEIEDRNNVDVGGFEASFGENVLEFEGRERSTRESTPCNLIRDPESIRTPGSTTRPTCSAEANRRTQNSMQRQIPTANEMDDFFATAEDKQQRKFIEKYNFDPLKDKPLPGRYEWVKLDP